MQIGKWCFVFVVAMVSLALGATYSISQLTPTKVNLHILLAVSALKTTNIFTVIVNIIIKVGMGRGAFGHLACTKNIYIP